MAWRIRWTPLAVEDLTSIRDFIAVDSRRYANAVVREIRDVVRSLREMPRRGHVVPEFERERLRQISVYSYRVIYRVKDGVVEILGVIHGARDLPSLWKREGRPTDGK